MIYFKSTFLLLQLLILVVEMHSYRKFFRGKFFGDNSKKILGKADVSPIEENWFLQKLDHFKTEDERTWYQRYFVSEEFYNKRESSPIFLMVGGEGAISDSFMTSGNFWVDKAVEHRALLLQLEHRFYGTSQPTTESFYSSFLYKQLKGYKVQACYHHSRLSLTKGLLDGIIETIICINNQAKIEIKKLFFIPLKQKKLRVHDYIYLKNAIVNDAENHGKDVSTENLQYLTVEQALEDAVSFIAFIKEEYGLGKNNKLILFGGSYPGNLVAWLRLKYPHLVYGVVSSSGPVLSVVDFKDYYKVVAESLATYSRACVTSISEAFASIDQLSQEKSGQETLTSTLSLCEPLEESEDFENDFSMLNNALAGNIAGVVQYNKVDHSSNQTIDNICKIMANKTLGSTSLERLAALTKVFLYSDNATCLEYNYQNFIDYNTATNWSDPVNLDGSRQWFFQTCNQMGYFQSSSYSPHVFGNKFPVERFIQQCMDVFGEQYNATFIEDKIRKTNNDYGGLDIVNNVNRVVFVHGSIDPWHALGVLNSTNIRSPAIYITGTAHCADMNSDDIQDLPQLLVARQVISSYIRSWLL